MTIVNMMTSLKLPRIDCSPSNKAQARNQRQRMGIGIACLVWLIFLWSNGAQLRILTIDEDYVNALRLAGVISIFIGCVLTFTFRRWRMVLRNHYFHAILALLAVVMLPTFVTGVFQYQQGMIEVIRLPWMYYALFVFVLLFFMISPRDRIHPLIMTVVWTVVSICTLFVIASWLPGVAEQLFIDGVNIGNRFGSSRLTASASVNNLAVFAVIYLVVQLVTPTAPIKQKIINSIGLLIVLWYLNFVLISRARLIGLLICLAILFLRYIHWRKLLIPGVALLGIFVYMQVVTEHKPLDILIGSYQSILTKDRESERDTVSIRLDGIQYYYFEFVKSQLVGIGLVSRVRTGNSDVGYAMTELAYNPADLGIIAVLFFFGFPGLIVTIVISARIFKDTRMVLHKGTLENRNIALAIRLYLIYYIVSFYHIFLYEEYALEWGMLFFALAHIYAESRLNTTEKHRPCSTISPICR